VILVILIKITFAFLALVVMWWLYRILEGV